MKVDVISSSSPYILDTIKDQNSIVALTRKNADFIEAVVGLDSNYRADFDVANPNSTAYWFNIMKTSRGRYDEALKKCIVIIDSVNSTHLESTINGRDKMFEIIKNYCETPDELKTAVCVDPTQGNFDNLFYKLCVSMDNHKGFKANNISFASKFISYARKYLNDNDTSFSKYDSVVSKKLSLYEHLYVDRTIKIVANKYTNDPNKRRELSDNEKQIFTYNVYLAYAKAINNILESLREDNGINLNKEEFDHIVWYATKGE